MISVVLAAYKGEKYIASQVESILCQLGDDDELIITDDYPEGKTYSAIESIVKADSRVKYIHGKSQGLIKNFEHGLNNAKGDYIFLSDQDDKWIDGKVDAVMKEFAKGADVVLHDALITDADLNPTGERAFEINSTVTGFVRNIIKNSYQGSCMAFTKEIKDLVLPFPDKIPMHDQWIGLLGEKYGKVHLVNEPYIYYRRHGENVSGGTSSLMTKIRWRFNIIRCLLRK